MRVQLHCSDSSVAVSWARRLADAGAEFCPDTQPQETHGKIDALILVLPTMSDLDQSALPHIVRALKARLPGGKPIIAAAAGFPRCAEELLEAGVTSFLSDTMETEEIRIRLRAACGMDAEWAESMCVRARTTLALSLAHDYNNILSAIQGNVDLSLMAPSISQDLRYNLEQIGKSVGRAAGLTKSLIEWLRPELPGSCSLDLAETLRRLAPLIHEMAGKREVELSLPREPVRVEISLQELVSLLAGYFLRAAPGDGSGKVRAAVTIEEKAAASLEMSVPGEPEIEAFRREFRILSPESAVTAIDEPSSGGGTILLVDDEDAIRNAAQRILRREGYTVLEASSGEEGLELFKTIGGMIDAVILDLHMPGMEGGEVLHHMRDLRPEVRVVVWSGFPEEMARRQMNGFADVAFLEKPTQLAEFPVMLARALKSEQA